MGPTLQFSMRPRRLLLCGILPLLGKEPVLAEPLLVERHVRKVGVKLPSVFRVYDVDNFFFAHFTASLRS